jgi:short-subunit dehydrogenase
MAHARTIGKLEAIFCAPNSRLHYSTGDLGDAIVREHVRLRAEKFAIECVVHAAGIYGATIYPTETIDTNLSDVIELTYALETVLHKSPRPQIIAINSVAAFRPGPDEAVYAASKAGLHTFMQTFRYRQLSHVNPIRVLEIFPGAIKTAMCKGRPSYDKLMDTVEVAHVIVGAANTRLSSVCIDELHLSRRL